MTRKKQGGLPGGGERQVGLFLFLLHPFPYWQQFKHSPCAFRRVICCSCLLLGEALQPVVGAKRTRKKKPKFYPGSSSVSHMTTNKSLPLSGPPFFPWYKEGLGSALSKAPSNSDAFRFSACPRSDRHGAKRTTQPVSTVASVISLWMLGRPEDAVPRGSHPSDCRLTFCFPPG